MRSSRNTLIPFFDAGKRCTQPCASSPRRLEHGAQYHQRPVGGGPVRTPGDADTRAWSIRSSPSPPDGRHDAVSHVDVRNFEASWWLPAVPVALPVAGGKVSNSWSQAVAINVEARGSTSALTVEEIVLTSISPRGMR